MNDKEIDKFASRRKKMTEACLEEDFDNFPTGIVALLYLIHGKDDSKKRMAEETICRTASWFDGICCPLDGREPQGECDFAAAALARTLYMAFDVISLGCLEKIKRFFFENDFESKYKSENHMLLFHASRYLIGLMWSDEFFTQYQRTGKELADDDEKFLLNFIKFRAANGWAEFDSLGYMAEHINGLLLLYDFAPKDGILQRIAGMSLNQLLLDMISDDMDGLYCGAHGRIYDKNALDFATAPMLSIDWLYFGHKYENQALKNPVAEVCLSDFIPDDILYELISEKPSIYENFESCHLHCISAGIPQKQVEQIDGSINKYTYITPLYAIGAVNYQDEYPKGNEAGWYAHHEQHEWELTINGATDIRIFSHHPGNYGTEGNEHGYWTGDLGCCCSQSYCRKNIAITTYDIPNDQIYEINANIPFKYFRIVENDKRLFLKYGDVYIMLWFSNGYRKKREGDFSEREIISEGRKHAVICEVGTKYEYRTFIDFMDILIGERIYFDKESMSVKYKDMYMDKNIRRNNGYEESFPYPMFKSPFAISKRGSGVIEIKTNAHMVRYDFNKVKVECM